MDGPGLDPLRSIRLVLAETARNLRRERARHPARIGHASPDRQFARHHAGFELAWRRKDIIASNLAHHYALTGQRVLLIDGDLRRAPLTRKLAPQRALGLLDTLVRHQPVESAILHDKASDLYFLPAMSPTPLETARPEMLASRRMAETIHSLTKQFDIILIDAPPLLPVVDARILADYSDQIVFVTTWRKTPKQLAKRALQSLGFNHEKVAGVVMNSVAQHALEESYSLGTQMTGLPRKRLARAA